VARPAAIAAAIRQHFMNEVGAFVAVRHTTDRLATESPATRRTLTSPEMLGLQDGSVPPGQGMQVDRGGSGLLERGPIDGRSTGQHAAPSPHTTGMLNTQSMLPQTMVSVPQTATPLGVPASMLHAQLPAAPTYTPGFGNGMDAKLMGLASGNSLKPPSTQLTVAAHDYIETLNVLVALLEQERGELRGHSMTVVRIARRMCERLGLPAEETDPIVVAAYLHDLGKTSSLHLTALNVSQYENHRLQAKKSYLTPTRLFEAVRLPDRVVPILTHLYERPDGQGFPDRLSAKEIPLGSRLLAIAETYADLTGQSANAYRRKLTAEEAFDVMGRHKGKLFDSTLVDVLKLVVLGGDLRAKLLADRRRALLVDPDAEESTVLELRLVEHGFDVTIARTSNDAENELVNEFDIVISEVELKPLDGFALLQKVRASGNEVPFVFLSQKDESDIAKRSFELGAGDFITRRGRAQSQSRARGRGAQEEARRRERLAHRDGASRHGPDSVPRPQEREAGDPLRRKAR
jgi:response regulator RpfG family c-di-GMP phosphodiesterase